MKVTIDNITIDVPEGSTILEAARLIGPDVAPPAMCYYSSLEGSGGKCRTCLVKITQNSEKDPKGTPKLVASCRTPAAEGMVVQNYTSPEVIQARKDVVELLLINHPLDCPVCDQAGECDLQNLAFKHGQATTEYEEPRREYDPVDLGDKIKLHMNRCILCYRCVYTADQITDGRAHGVLGRGDAAEIGTYIQTAIENDFSGNVIDVCPVGALTDKTFRFKSRVWFSKPMNAHRNCTTCSGEATLWLKGNEVLRVSARKNMYGEVQKFICNTCRFESKSLEKWTVEGPAPVPVQSVISQNHYKGNAKVALSPNLLTPNPDLEGSQI
jgi:NADH-quinone oxidoreductase subunit G